MATNKRSNSILTAALLVGLLSLLLFTSPVHAEGDVPPSPESAPEVIIEEVPLVEGSIESTVPQDEPVVDEEVILETPVIVDLPVESTPPVVEPTQELIGQLAEQTVDSETEMLQSVDENEITLVGADGEPLPLTEVETAQILSAADPYFKVGTITYRFLPAGGDCSPYPVGTCFVSFPGVNPIQDAIDYIVTNSILPTDRKIYVESGAYSGVGLVSLDAIANPFLKSINGLIGAGSGTTTISENLEIKGTTLGFTLSGFTVTGGILFQSNIGTLNISDVTVSNPVGRGIEISPHSGPVNLTYVSARWNAAEGVVISNTGLTTYTVKVLGSEFDNNGMPGTNVAGLSVSAGGAVTVDGISASRNNGDGADFLEFLSLSVTNSIFNQNISNPFDPLWGFGIYTNPTGVRTIGMNDVMAVGNENAGLYLLTHGSISLNNVEARLTSTGPGLYADNSAGASTVAISVGNSTFNYNDSGLQIYSKGNVALNIIIANYNNTNGGMIDTCIFDGLNCLGTGTVTLTSNQFGNGFSNNGNDGLVVYAKGNITLTNIKSTNNTNSGVYLDTALGANGIGNITINATTPNWANLFEYNGAEGIKINSRGTVSITMSQVNGNGGDGANIDISFNTLAKWVGLSNSTFDYNTGSGLVIVSRGTISLSGVQASNNGDNGVELDNTLGTNMTISTLNSSLRNYAAKMEGNTNAGLIIQTKSAVSLSRVWANENGLEGAVIQNLLAANPITLTTAYFDGNGTIGLDVDALGNIIWSGGSASSNGVTGGANLDNTTATGIVSITVSNVKFNENSFDGLEAFSKGNITLTNINANNNQGGWAYGVWVDNCLMPGACMGTGNVVISATSGFINTFDGNEGYGLYITTKGSITVTNISANSNGWSGAYLYNAETGSSAGVSMSYLGQTNTFDNNKGNGLEIYSFGNIMLYNLTARWNRGGPGAILDNKDAASVKVVSIGYGLFSDNQGDGLQINTKGTISLLGVSANNNSMFWSNIALAGETVYERIYKSYDVWEFSGNAGDPVSIVMNSSDFESYVLLYDSNWNLLAWDASWFGALINTNLPTAGTYYIMAKSFSGTGIGNYDLALNDPGNVNQTPMTPWYGAYLDNYQMGAGSGNISISERTTDKFDGNNYTGLYVVTKGSITTVGLKASYNAGLGAYLDNLQGTAGVSISYSSTSGQSAFEYNESSGLEVYTRGAITTNGLWTKGNQNYGAILDNTTSTTSAGVSVTGSNFIDNLNDGVIVQTRGTITFLDVRAYGNSNYGFWLDSATFSTSPKTISLSRIYVAYNGMDGIHAEALGGITLNNIEAWYNGLDGVHVNNDFVGANGNISVQNSWGSNSFSFNGQFFGGAGLRASTRGYISLSGVTAISNLGEGLHLDTSSGIGVISIINANLRYNDDHGVSAVSNNTIYLSGVKSYSNGFVTNGDGVNLSTIGHHVYIYNSYIIGNYGNGIDATVLPFSVILSNTYYYGNDVDMSGDANLLKS
jgi:hypothetical protein